MKEYYLEQIKMSEKTIELLNIGFCELKNKLADDLKNAKSVEETEKIIEGIKSYQEVIDISKKNLEYNLQKYKEFSGEPYEREVARVTIFGEIK